MWHHSQGNPNDYLIRVGRSNIILFDPLNVCDCGRFIVPVLYLALSIEMEQARGLNP
jgi:hypothetical protein